MTLTAENPIIAKRAKRAWEARVRRKAHRLDLALVKSRTRNPHAYTTGTYGLIDPEMGAWVTTDPVGRGYGWDLDEIEQYLDGLAEQHKAA